MITFDGLPNLLSGQQSELKEWLHKIVLGYGGRIATLNYRFLNDEEIQAVNRIHLDHDYPTDIISFGYKEGLLIEGDILIGTETVKRNAGAFNVSVREEFCRVMAHGLLHLLGYNDQTEEEKTEMRSQEEKCLILRPKNLRYK